MIPPRRAKYPLHRTNVRKILECRDGETGTNKNNKNNEKNTNCSLPPFLVGQLIDFKEGRYTIKWKRPIIDGADNCISEISARGSLSASSESMTSLSCHHIEQWTEAKVASGVLLHQCMGIKIAKLFDVGVFIGRVTDVYTNEEQTLYTVLYEDEDAEDFNQTELQKGIDLYCKMQTKKRKRRPSSNKKPTSSNSMLAFSNDTSFSFPPLHDKSIPIHTLILGTHPAKKSLNVQRYFVNPCNVFFWIAGDCLGFRRDNGETARGGAMKLCTELRHGISRVITYDEQVNILCKHGFALWDIVASCRRKGSLDSAITSDRPNDIRRFVEKHPTIQTIVFANGKSGLDVFNRHFKDWWSTGEITPHESSCGKLCLKNKLITPKSSSKNAITCICALSVSPAAATSTYKQKRDFWDKFVYSPGLKLHAENIRR